MDQIWTKQNVVDKTGKWKRRLVIKKGVSEKKAIELDSWRQAIGWTVENETSFVPRTGEWVKKNDKPWVWKDCNAYLSVPLEIGFQSE